MKLSEKLKWWQEEGSPTHINPAVHFGQLILQAVAMENALSDIEKRIADAVIIPPILVSQIEAFSDLVITSGQDECGNTEYGVTISGTGSMNKAASLQVALNAYALNFTEEY